MVERSEGDLARRYRELDDTFRPHRDGEEAIRPGCLVTFPYEYRDRDAEVAVETDEFTALCPWSGLPDFGKLTVRYVPDRECLELKSLKYYLLSFRSVGILQENAANRILADLLGACRPKRMTVTLNYRVRGGLHSVVTVNHP